MYMYIQIITNINRLIQESTVKIYGSTNAWIPDDPGKMIIDSPPGGNGDEFLSLATGKTCQISSSWRKSCPF